LENGLENVGKSPSSGRKPGRMFPTLFPTSNHYMLASPSKVKRNTISEKAVFQASWYREVYAGRLLSLASHASDAGSSPAGTASQARGLAKHG